MQPSQEKAVETLCANNTQYPPQAYRFVLRSLDFGSERFNKDRETPHLNAEELYLASCALALEEYGPLASVVLNSWNIWAPKDYSQLIYNMIDGGLLSKQTDDKPEDFYELPALDSLLEAPYTPNSNEGSPS